MTKSPDVGRSVLRGGLFRRRPSFNSFVQDPSLCPPSSNRRQESCFKHGWWFHHSVVPYLWLPRRILGHLRARRYRGYRLAAHSEDGRPTFRDLSSPRGSQLNADSSTIDTGVVGCMRTSGHEEYEGIGMCLGASASEYPSSTITSLSSRNR